MVRRAGGRWRILVHDYRGRLLYGKSHHVQSHPDMHSRVLTPEQRQQVEESRRKHSTTTVLEGTEFDELVVGRWIHLEQMATGSWWMDVGGVTLWIRADRDGRPKRIDVYGPGDYADPVEGCEYSLTWSGDEVDRG